MKPITFWTILIILTLIIWILVGFGIIHLIEGYSFTIQGPKITETQNNRVLVGRIITAYTASPDETDNTPCKGALSGIDFCNPKRSLIATNELPLGTSIKIDNTEYLVADRTNSRYNYRYDILVDSKEKAYNWGRKVKNIKVKSKLNNQYVRENRQNHR